MIYIFIGALCISSAPLLVRNVELGSGFIGFVRCLTAFVFLFPFVLKDRQHLLQTLKDWPTQKWLLLAGFSFFVDLFIWHKSIHIIGAGKATVLGNTQVFYSGLLGLLFFKEKINLKFVLGSLVAMTGIYLIIGFESGNRVSTNYNVGVLYGLLTGFFYSIYVLSLSKLSRLQSSKEGLSDITKLALVSLYCGLFFLLATLWESWPKTTTSSDWISLIALGIVAHALGWMSIKKGLKTTPLAIGGLILLLQPVNATLLSSLLFAETLQIVQVFGLVLAIGGIALGVLSKSRSKA